MTDCQGGVVWRASRSMRAQCSAFWYQGCPAHAGPTRCPRPIRCNSRLQTGKSVGRGRTSRGRPRAPAPGGGRPSSSIRWARKRRVRKRVDVRDRPQFVLSVRRDRQSAHKMSTESRCRVDSVITRASQSARRVRKCDRIRGERDVQLRTICTVTRLSLTSCS
jgi:hypothetical protein